MRISGAFFAGVALAGMVSSLSMLCLSIRDGKYNYYTLVQLACLMINSSLLFFWVLP